MKKDLLNNLLRVLVFFLVYDILYNLSFDISILAERLKGFFSSFLLKDFYKAYCVVYILYIPFILFDKEISIAFKKNNLQYVLIWHLIFSLGYTFLMNLFFAYLCKIHLVAPFLSFNPFYIIVPITELILWLIQKKSFFGHAKNKNNE